LRRTFSFLSFLFRFFEKFLLRQIWLKKIGLRYYGFPFGGQFRVDHFEVPYQTTFTKFEFYFMTCYDQQ
jgi:hypothetical protein